MTFRPGSFKQVPPFLFVRHGETDWNRAGRLQGQLDIPLNATGREQASEAGHRAAALLSRQGRSPATLRCLASPLGRTRETMERLRTALGLPSDRYAMDDRLKEFSFGEWEGCTWPEVKTRDPAQAKERRRDKWNFTPPGGGESYRALADRVAAWLLTLEEDSLVVSHAGVARTLMVMLGGLSREAAPETEILQGRVLCFGESRWRWA